MDEYQKPDNIISHREEQMKNIQEQLSAQQQALVQIYKSTEKTRKILMWSGIVSVAMFVLPLIIVLVMLPKILGTFTASMGGLDASSLSDLGGYLEGIQELTQ